MNKPILEINNIYKTFGTNPVLKGVNLSVHSGEIIGYIGPNGAGKSTTVKMILGMLPIEKGDIQLFGESISINNTAYKSRIGYVPEDDELYETLSAEEYLHFVGGLYNLSQEEVNEKGQEMMTLLGIGDEYKQRLSSYSKGMRQKVLIISSLLHDPDILFWDEPLNGLDANSVQIMKELLTQLKADGKTIFYSSHIMDTVEKLSDRIVLLNDGRVVADGSFDELKKDADGNLEQLFNEITGFDKHRSVASDFISVMKGN